MAASPSDAEHLAIRLRASVSHLARRLRNGAGDDGPGAAKLGVLGQLYRIGPLTPTGLAQHERVRVQTLTRLLAELEADRLVRRRADPHDARRTLLSLTPAGVRVLKVDIRRREASLAAAIGDRLSDVERAALHDACAILDHLADGLESKPPAAAHRTSSGRTSRRDGAPA